MNKNFRLILLLFDIIFTSDIVCGGGCCCLILLCKLCILFDIIVAALFNFILDICIGCIIGSIRDIIPYIGGCDCCCCCCCCDCDSCSTLASYIGFFINGSIDGDNNFLFFKSFNCSVCLIIVVLLFLTGIRVKQPKPIQTNDINNNSKPNDINDSTPYS
ncbi:hypothetical protein DERP_008964 [Dermatophagoides pteronyssinus]|uniref:Uncharacterized protein n=1 Tax=Dermatophagoides pteronyssinus TaxID=6956 RepID=A0ABQ8JGL2_DERPT|nr:hypothetical protein DERP_008964 [Dermatophagoides pteronyssinus]